MKHLKLFFILLIAMIFVLGSPMIQAQGKTKVRPSLKADVSQTIGLDTNINISYSRPGVKGRKIWGELVPYGLTPGNKYSKNKPFPWRAGANEMTTVEFSKPVLVEGKELSAGKYGLHMIPSKEKFIVIFNKVNKGWGSYAYDKTQDALRINVVPVKAQHKEWLTYCFEDLAGTSTTLCLLWEKIKLPIKVELGSK